MSSNYRYESPKILLDFLAYHETIKAHSSKTVDEYFLDLRNFFRYLKQLRDPSLRDVPFDEIGILDVDLSLIRTVTLTDIYGYMTYLSRERVVHQNSENSNKGLSTASRARKLATIRSFFNYLCNKAHLLENNPCKDIDSPKIMKTLPRYLTLNESISLLDSVDGANRERDYCILTFFLNCGLRISELIGLNRGDIHDDALRILGKGNKVRIVYLNQACQDALSAYLAIRKSAQYASVKDKGVFLSRLEQRMSVKTVQWMIYKYLNLAGLEAKHYSVHKLRHTAATLMYQSGAVDVRVLKEILGHEQLNTTQIYTHVSNKSIEDAMTHNPLAARKKTK